MIEAGQERVEASDNDSDHRTYRPHSLQSTTISFINLCYYLEYLASKRLASHYTPVLYFFAIFICITKRFFLDRATELPFCIIYPLAAATAAAVFILVLISGVEALLLWSACSSHEYVGAVFFNSMLDSTLRVFIAENQRWDGRIIVYIRRRMCHGAFIRMYIYKAAARLMQRRRAGRVETEGSDSLLSHGICVGPCIYHYYLLVTYRCWASGTIKDIIEYNHSYMDCL
jgi:hypothetical protein